MNERNENDKLDEILLPGFRFHPTDEELVGFYLKRKIQQRSLSIELIKQLDIYKYDPWDLPKLAITGEKEWYFYCPRDRKYRNSARPNRVTGGGFWKATGTDRPIYSSQGSKCIGLKKSLVFYKGKAAKGIKTDWMMHEFRLPSLTDVSVPPKRFIDKSTIPAANDAWAICRIFKKTNSTAQRALSQSWVSPLPESATATATATAPAPATAAATDANVKSSYNITQLSSSLQYFNNNYNNDIQQQRLDFLPYKPINPAVTISKHVPHHQLPISTGDITNSFMLSPFELPTIPPVLLNTSSSSSMLGDFNSKVPEECIDFGRSHQDECMSSFSNGDRMMNHVLDDQWESTTVRSIGFPYSLLWDSFSSCPSEMSTSVSTSKCYT